MRKYSTCGERETVRRDDADVARHVDEAALVEGLRSTTVL